MKTLSGKDGTLLAFLALTGDREDAGTREALKQLSDAARPIGEALKPGSATSRGRRKARKVSASAKKTAERLRTWAGQQDRS